MTKSLFFGHWLGAIDAKGRLSIPVNFRSVLAAKSSGEDVMIGPGHAGRRCLMAMDTTEAEELYNKFLARHGEAMTPEAYAEAAFLSGSLLPFKIDDAGRIVLSSVYKSIAGITSHVWFVASFHKFEMWDPWQFLAQADVPDVQRAQLREDLAARGLSISAAAT